jgi:hypothetical protein
MKDFVDYEEAYELKKLGFDEECFGFYDTEGLQITYHASNRTNKNSLFTEHGTTNNPKISAPTFSQSFRFFREKYGLRNRNYGSLNYSGTISEYFEIFQYAKGTSDKVLSIIVCSLTYEEAELSCLRKLIEIAKQKQ